MTVGITAPLIAAGAASFKMASDVEESINKVEVAFQKKTQTRYMHGQKPPCNRTGRQAYGRWFFGDGSWENHQSRQNINGTQVRPSFKKYIAQTTALRLFRVKPIA